MLTVKILPNEKISPPGKLADAELHFTADGLDAPLGANLDADRRTHDAVQGAVNALRALDGLKLIGFAIWERRTDGGRNVTFPARQYSVNGERRSFTLLRPIADASAQEQIRDLILSAFAAWEEQQQPEADAPARP